VDDGAEGRQLDGMRAVAGLDGVVQGLSEVPFMQDVDHWGVVTIGTSLGNARFTNRRKDRGKGKNGDKGKNGKDKNGKEEKKSKD